MDFAELAQTVAQSLRARYESDAPDRTARLAVPQAEGRSQSVEILWDGEVLRARTQCSSRFAGHNNAELYRYLLRKNTELLGVAFALDSRECVHLVWSQVGQEISAESLKFSLANLAAVGDFMECKFSGPEMDRF